MEKEPIDKLLYEVRLRLKEQRRIKRYTQTEVEEKTGIKQSLLSAFETGSRDLSMHDILALCSAYEYDPSRLFAREPAAQAQDVRPENGLYEALFLEQKLTEPLRQYDVGFGDAYLKLCIYKAIRIHYMLNPYHKNTKLFEVSDAQVEKALEKVSSDMEFTFTNMIKATSAVIKRLELAPEYGAQLRAFIKAAEDEIRSAC